MSRFHENAIGEAFCSLLVQLLMMLLIQLLQDTFLNLNLNVFFISLGELFIVMCVCVCVYVK